MQPLLHDLVTTTAAPTTGAVRRGRADPGGGVQGVFHADVRVLADGACCCVDGREPEPIGHAPAGAGATRFVSVVRWLGDPIADPTVRIDRIRRVTPARPGRGDRA